jgi:hypothetical protein
MVDFSKIEFSDEFKSSLAKNNVEQNPIDWDSLEFLEEGLAAIDELRTRRNKRLKGLAVEFGEGITLGFLGELASLVRSASSEMSYREAKDQYEAARIVFKQQNPQLADTAFAAEIIGSIPTSFGIAGAATKVGMGLTKAGALEGAVYGVGSGDSFEERVANGVIGGLAGLTVGKVLDAAVMPSSSGGFKDAASDMADDSLPIPSKDFDVANERALAEEVFDEVDDPKYSRKPLSEAQTAGELWDGLKGAFVNFYNDKVTGISDQLMRYSPQVGARYQRADETALRIIDKDMSDMANDLVPVINIINDSERAKGILLDYAGGFLGKTRTQAMARLEKELANDLNTAHMATLKRYLDYSFNKNSTLNKNVFGAKFFREDQAYLHTRNRAYRQKLKDEGMSEAEVDKLFEDPAFKTRTRASYLKQNADSPKPAEYDNPIVSDMQRLFKMERFNQLQRIFGVNVDEASEVFGRSLSPTEFMDELAYTLVNKGISQDGAFFMRDKITEGIMGQSATPHPLIQAASSMSYATTLAGPMSAILNLADIPLLGAKYGGRAVLEGLKVVSPFKKAPSADLKKMGLGNQTFGEFVNKINDQVQDRRGFLLGTVAKVREGSDMLMKGSGFAAIDQVGKQGVMRGVLRSAADDANAGKLADNWGFYFNDAELEVLTNQLKQHGMDWTKYTGKGAELVEELMFAGLGQQQLISAAGRPAAWARNPNLRPLWALRGFVVKQQALALREVVGNIKAGKPEEAAKFLGRYAAYGAGGYAIINEARQGIFGDGEMSVSGLVRGYGDAWASLLTANTLGLNDYQYGRIKENGLMLTFLEGMMPIAVDRPLDIGGRVVDALDGERYGREVLTDALPIVKQTARGVRNIEELAGTSSPARDLAESLLERKPQD